ncbi:MAG: dephospho-CoA kinase [Bdellovibrionales bacterium]|nr:dephospho-CoA kinase [Bdellovibrionales bacterium]
MSDELGNPLDQPKDPFTGSLADLTQARVIGLTGGIASGKSTVAQIFASIGFPVVDADQISRDLNSPNGAAYPAIVSRFGTGDRMKLREIIFKDPKARADLEAILHPLIRTESLLRIQKAASGSQFDPPIVLYEAALLLETGRYREFEGVIVVDTPMEIRKKRLVARDRLSEDLADAILKSQATDAERKQIAKWIVPNAGDLNDLRRAVLEVAKKLVG